ncbi:MAG: DNA polymerase III subunit beta [Chloroflexi bacterium]|nr:DNA polymerase III subunit beta [Chloroflexota bacterium]
MRVDCLQENLAKGLSVVNRAISSRTTLPILQNVLLKAEAPASLKLSATNLDIAINCWIAADVGEEGATTVPARLVTDFVNTLPSGPIHMELNVRTQSLHMSCDRTEANFRVIDASDFPVIPTGNGNSTLSLPPATLRHMIQQVAFAASTDESRPTLTGVYVTTDEDRLVFVATDGYRLAYRATRVEDVPTDLAVIVPARSLSELARIAADADEEGEATLTVTEDRNQVVFQIPGKGTHESKGAFQRAELVSQLIDATYPNYKAIIPSKWDTRVILNTQEFAQAIRRAYLFARESSNIVKLTITPGEPGTLHLYASSTDYGDHHAELDAVVEGQGLDIAFNGRYLLDVMQIISSPQMVLELTKPNRPGIIRPVGMGEDEFLYVLMPMNVR